MNDPLTRNAHGIREPISLPNLYQPGFASLLKRAGLPHRRLYGPRHTGAALLFTKRVHLQFIHELLGHATRAITLDTYIPVMSGMGD
jgi:integrase